MMETDPMEDDSSGPQEALGTAETVMQQYQDEEFDVPSFGRAVLDHNSRVGADVSSHRLFFHSLLFVLAVRRRRSQVTNKRTQP